MPRGLVRLGSLTILLQRYSGLPRLAQWGQMGTWEPCTAAPGSDTCSSSPPHLPLASPSLAMSQHPLTQIVESLAGGAVRSAPSAITQEKKMPLSKMRRIFKNHNLFWLAVSTSGWQYYNSLERNFHFEFQLGKLVAIFPFSESKGDHSFTHFLCSHTHDSIPKLLCLFMISLSTNCMLWASEELCKILTRRQLKYNWMDLTQVFSGCYKI